MANHSPEFLPGESNLVGYTPWGCKESDRLSDYTFTFTFIDYTRAEFIIYILEQNLCICHSDSPTQFVNFSQDILEIKYYL